ncbi:MFS transporter [Actinotalea solisilvae]|uniref:MFS transporter n=1 Tax=Actinotalea solisilvae TaxID=2072922 RepID=UPI0018F188B2|nr:MFS transporter [Actinotalea solisilvae]
MDTDTPTTPRATAAAAPAVGLPWPSLLVLGAATFLVVTGEMLPTAVLPQMSADLGVPPARTGLLVSLWAATVVVLSFPLVRLTRRWERRRVIAGALAVFGVASVLTALADSFAAAAAARVLGAATTGLLWAVVNAHTAAVAGERHLARAVAVVLGGATLGTVVGVPAVNVVARVADWRIGFVALGVAAAALAVAIPRVVAPADDVVGSPAPDARGARALGPVVAVTALVGLVLVGHFAAFTFVTTLVDGTAAHVPGGVSGVLLLFGVVSALGVALVGRVPDARTAAALAAATSLVAVALLGLTVLGAHPALGLGVVVLWALSTGALPPLAQTTILRLAGPGLRATAATLIPVTFNLGIAVGAALGSAATARLGAEGVPAPAAAVVVVAGVGLAATARRDARARRSRPARTP